MGVNPLVFGVIDVLLLFALVLRCVRRADVAFAAAVLLFVTPAHAFFSRTAASEGIWPLPFVLGWAVGLTALTDRPSAPARWMLAGGTASLLASALAHASAAMMVAVFAIVTIVMFRRADGWQARDALPALAVVGAALALLPLVLLIVRGGYVAVLERWVPHLTDAGSVAAWLRAVAWHRAATVSNWFWNFFLPSHVFLAPDAPGLCGMFLTPTAVPIAAGVYTLIRNNGEEAGRLGRLRPMIAAGCIGAPLTAAIASHPPLDGRALIVAPLGVLLAVAGSSLIWRRGGLAGRSLLVTLYVAAAIQAVLCRTSP